MDREVKLVKLRDITLYHLQKQNPNIDGSVCENLEHDIIVYFKNFLMTCEELHVTPNVNWVGDNNSDKESLQ